MIIRYIILIFTAFFVIWCSLNETEIWTWDVEKDKINSEIEKIEKIKIIEIEDYSGLNEDEISKIEQLKEIWRRMYKIKEYEKSIQAYTRILEIDKNNFEAHYRIGNSYSTQSKYIEARPYFEEAIKIRPDLAYIINPLLASGYYHLWDANKAIILHKKAIRQNKDYYFAYVILETMDWGIWSIDEKVAFEEKQIERFYNYYNAPENSKLIQFFEATWTFWFSEIIVAHKYESLWHLYFNGPEKDYNIAAGYFKKAYETVPYLNAYFLLWFSYFHLEDYEKAESIFEEIISYAPTHLKSYLYLLEIHKINNNMNKWDIIIMSYKNMLDFYEDNWYWNPDSYFAQSNFINKDSKEFYHWKYKIYNNIFK